MRLYRRFKQKEKNEREREKVNNNDCITQKINTHTHIYRNPFITIQYHSVYDNTESLFHVRR
jgi:hypothetical protein